MCCPRQQFGGLDSLCRRFTCTTGNCNVLLTDTSSLCYRATLLSAASAPVNRHRLLLSARTQKVVQLCESLCGTSLLLNFFAVFSFNRAYRTSLPLRVTSTSAFARSYLRRWVSRLTPFSNQLGRPRLRNVLVRSPANGLPMPPSCAHPNQTQKCCHRGMSPTLL